MTREEFESKLLDIDEGERHFYRGQESIDAEQALLDHDQAQREEIAKLREALKFYANPQTYGIHGGSVNRVLSDAGKVAQAALAKEATHDKAE